MCQPHIDGHALDCMCGESDECVCGGDSAAGRRQELHSDWCGARDRLGERQEAACEKYGQELTGLFEVVQEFAPHLIIPGPEEMGPSGDLESGGAGVFSSRLTLRYVDAIDGEALEAWFGVYPGWSEELCDAEIESGHLKVISWTCLEGVKWGFVQGL